MEKCGHCGFIGKHPSICPTIKAIEYFPDGTVKRVEYKTPADYAAPVHAGFEKYRMPSPLISPVAWWPPTSGPWGINQ